MLDEEDLELLKENKTGKRKLKKMNEDVDESPAKVKSMEQIDSKVVKLEDKRNDVKKQIFEKRGDTTTADDEKLAGEQGLKDKFMTEEIDELFGTA